MREGIIIAVTLLLDMVTKHAIQTACLPGQSTTVIDGFFYIHYVQNDGAAWSMLRGKQVLLSLIAVVAIFVMLKYMLEAREKKQNIEAVCLAFMIAGAAGNLIDRLMLGYVRDFLDFFIFGYDFPVFNVADMALSVGVIVLIAWMLFSDRKDQKA